MRALRACRSMTAACVASAHQSRSERSAARRVLLVPPSLSSRPRGHILHSPTPQFGGEEDEQRSARGVVAAAFTPSVSTMPPDRQSSISPKKPGDHHAQTVPDQDRGER
ncbi:MAG: hypothetical protein QOF87_4007, partial [Pseudonocardiales bacterium]|nr:hypothetical protein [Pseudonocardiales bacterium]